MQIKRMASTLLNLVHAYVYGRWTKQYIKILLNHIMPRLGPAGKQWVADRFHSKIVSPEQAQAIITLDRDIPLRDLEQIIPYRTARELMIKAPPDIAVYECSCRRTSANPCQPTQVCLIVGKPFVNFILKQHPSSSRRITSAEAVALIDAEHERGHIQTAWFKDAMQGRFYAICNCCKCCCFGIQAMIRYGAPMVAPSGYSATIDETVCEACGTCETRCPFEAVRVDTSAVLNWEACMGCGVCVTQCPNRAITVERDARKGEPFDVRLIS